MKQQTWVTLDSIRKGLEKSLPERHHKLIPMNMQALERGGQILHPHKA